MKPRFLFNPKTGAIFNYTDQLAAVPGIEEISIETAMEIIREQRQRQQMVLEAREALQKAAANAGFTDETMKVLEVTEKLRSPLESAKKAAKIVEKRKVKKAVDKAKKPRKKAVEGGTMVDIPEDADPDRVMDELVKGAE